VAFAIGAVTLAGQGLRRGLSSIVSRIRHRRLERASPNENAATGKDVA
jgi:hypothetical protein